MRLSISRVNTLYRCGMQYHFRYVEGIVSAPGVSAIVGKGTHRANASDLMHKMDSGELLPLDEVKAIAADATKREWSDQPPTLDDEEKAKGEEAVKGEAVDKTVVLAELYHTKVAPTIEPLGIEKEATVDLSNGDQLFMIKDLETPTHVRDTKTSGKSPDANAADVSLQLTAYLWESSLRGQPKSGALDYLVSTKTPKQVTLETMRGEADFAALARRLDLASSVIQSGLFSPCPPDSWACNPKWCGYWSRCPFGERGRTKK
jgi:hypothetical protein